MKKLLILSLALFLTSACGWHLRGTQPLPAELQILHLETPNQYSTLSKTLRRGLRAAGVTLTDDAKAAPFTLVVLGEDTNQRTLSTSERGKVSEYELTYQLRYAIKDQQGNTILGPDSITQRRSYVFDKNNVSSTYEERDILKTEMLRDMLQQLIRRYQAVRPGVTEVEQAAPGNES